MKTVFGPVPSRRLGFSLGVDLVPFKTCTLDCVYCQLGRTTNLTLDRREYVPEEQVIGDISTALGKGGRVDWITFSGSGEPTLHSRIGALIRRVKEMTSVPVAVLTNGTLLSLPQVRDDLSAADLVIPSVDAGTEEVFRILNRPHSALSLEKLIAGIAAFSASFPGRLWIEVMLVRGLNDSAGELGAIAAAMARIGPERVQLNTVVRPPAEPDALRLGPDAMEKAKSIMAPLLGGVPVDIVAGFEGARHEAVEHNVPGAIVDYLGRRPATLGDLSASLGLHRNEIVKYLTALIESGGVGKTRRAGEDYYILSRDEAPAKPEHV